MDIKDINIGLCQDMLRPNKARFAPQSLALAPLDASEELNVEWGPFSTPRQFPMLKDFLRYYTWPTNADQPEVEKRYVEGDHPEDAAFTVDGQDFHGRWRQAVVRERVEERRIGEREYFIQLTLRKGWVERFAWDEVLLGESFTSPGNSSSVSTDGSGGVVEAGSLTHDPEEVLMLRLKNCSPIKGQTIAKQIGAALTALSSGALVVEGESHGAADKWHFIVAHPQREDDGSVTIDFIVGKPRFTLNAFSNNNTAEQVNIGYLWNVPKALAQNIITAWDKDGTAGRSATASYDKDARMVAIVLTAKAGTENMTTAWVQVSCDTYQRRHFAWGYTEALVETFIATHNTAIGTTSDGKVIRARQTSVQIRGDGLFDVVVVETSFDNVDAGDVYTSYPYFSMTTPTGTKITTRRDYGYNIAISNLNLVKKVYDNATDAVTGEVLAQAGRIIEFQVTREDDCSFDYVATIRDQSSAIESSIEATTAEDAGIREKSWSVKGATELELAALEAKLQPAIRKRVSVRINAREDDLSDVDASEVEVRETTDDADSGGSGVGEALYVGSNADVGDVAALIAAQGLTSDKRKYINIAMTPKDDGSVGYAISKRTVQEAADNASSAGTDGSPVQVWAGHNVDEGDLNTLVSGVAASTRLHRLDMNLSGNDDGTFNYSVSRRTIVESDEDIQIGSRGENQTARVAANVAPTLLEDDAYPTDKGQRVILQAQFDDAGNMTFRKDTIQKVEQNAVLQGGSFVAHQKIEKSVGDVDQEADELNRWDGGKDGGAYDVDEGRSVIWQARLDADGAIDWDRVTQTSVEAISGTIADGVPTAATLVISRLMPVLERFGYTDSAVVFRNIRLENLGHYDVEVPSGSPPTGGEWGYIESLSMNDDRTFNGVKVVRVYRGAATSTAWDSAPDDIATWSRKRIIWSSDYSEYRRMTETISEAWKEDYDEAIAFFAASTAGFAEGLSYKVIAGKPYWHCVKVTGVSVEGWETNDGATTLVVT